MIDIWARIHTIEDKAKAAIEDIDFQALRQATQALLNGLHPDPAKNVETRNYLLALLKALVDPETYAKYLRSKSK